MYFGELINNPIKEYLRKTGLVLFLMCFVAGCTAAEEEEEGPSFYRDIRFGHWIWNGLDPLEMQEIFARLQASVDPEAAAASDEPVYFDKSSTGGKSNWVVEFETMGDEKQALAKQQQDIGNLGVAKELYMQASAAYALAKYPYFDENEADRRNYGKHLDTLETAWSLSDKSFERISIPYQGAEIDGILMLPANAAKGGFPLVLGTNGIDVLKGEFFDLAEQLTDSGVAFFAFDIAGTGSHSHLKLDKNYEHVTVAFIDHFQKDSRFNPDKFGLIGVSFGGNAVVKLAFTESDRVKAVVNMCGPVHSAFNLQPEYVQGIEIMYIDALVDRADIKEPSAEKIVDVFNKFSLVRQGYLVEGNKTDVPIFTVNAKGDYVAPVEDMELVNNATKDGTLVFSGADDHCPQDRFVVTPQVVDWFNEKLN